MPEQTTYFAQCGCSYQQVNAAGSAPYDFIRCRTHEQYSNWQAAVVATPFHPCDADCPMWTHASYCSASAASFA